MTLQEAMALYRRWNEDKFHEDVRAAGSKTVEDKWRQYLELIEFCWTLKPERSSHGDRQNQEDWEDYHLTMLSFEEKRKSEFIYKI